MTKTFQLVDLHCHIGEGYPPRDGGIGRRFTVKDLLNLPLTAIGIKFHHFIMPEEPSNHDKLKIIPSLTLNHHNGGLDEKLIIKYSKIWSNTPWIVYFPTLDSQHHIESTQQDKAYQKLGLKGSNTKPISLFLNSHLKPAVIKIIDTVAHFCSEGKKIIVATGHVSWQEAEQLATVSLRRKIVTIITHPNQRHIKMPLCVQKKLALKGAWIEHCAVFLDQTQTLPGVYSAGKMLEQMRKVGVNKCFLSSDCGQKNNPMFPDEAIGMAISALKTEGASTKEITALTFNNPLLILGLNL